MDEIRDEVSEPRTHKFSASAFALKGYLRLPFVTQIEPRGQVELSEEGGYAPFREGEFHRDSAISYRSAYTHVGGNAEIKPGGGWNTLATSVVEGLNIFDVVTADRIVAQINLRHYEVGYVPSVNFVGTRFENLRISGHPVKVDLDLGLVGRKPEGDRPYTEDKGFLERVARQYETVAQHPIALGEEMGRYNRVPSSDDCRGGLECSLVHSANPVEPKFPGRSFGHVLDIPHFGVVYLATLGIKQWEFDKDSGIPHRTEFALTMVQARLGCVGEGGVDGPGGVVNGHSKP